MYECPLHPPPLPGPASTAFPASGPGARPRPGVGRGRGLSPEVFTYLFHRKWHTDSIFLDIHFRSSTAVLEVEKCSPSLLWGTNPIRTTTDTDRNMHWWSSAWSPLGNIRPQTSWRIKISLPHFCYTSLQWRWKFRKTRGECYPSFQSMAYVIVTR